MNVWIVYLRRAKFDLVISDWMMASELIRGASLLLEEHSQVLFNCGGRLTLDRLETVRRTMFPKLHEVDTQYRQPCGQAVLGRQF